MDIYQYELKLGTLKQGTITGTGCIFNLLKTCVHEYANAHTKTPLKINFTHLCEKGNLLHF